MEALSFQLLIIKLKSNIISNYHENVFTNSFKDDDIEFIRKKYDDEEITEIFRPLAKIKSNHSTYRVGYYESESLNKKFISRLMDSQKKKLLPVKQISKEDIGMLENSIIHTRSSGSGKVTRSIILKEQLKALEFDIKVLSIEPKNMAQVLINEEIVVNVFFNSQNGFTFRYDDLNISNTNVVYHDGLSAFHQLFFDKIIYLSSLIEMEETDANYWAIIKHLINNPDSLNK